jgi:hypothetical protein
MSFHVLISSSEYIDLNLILQVERLRGQRDLYLEMHALSPFLCIFIFYLYNI